MNDQTTTAAPPADCNEALMGDALKIIGDLSRENPRRRAAEMVKRLIANRGCCRGDKLPSYRDLCRRFEVSLLTMERAMNDLRDEGVIYQVPRQGAFVARELTVGSRELKEVGLVLYGARTQLLTQSHLTGIFRGILEVCESDRANLQILPVMGDDGLLSPETVARSVDGALLLGIVNDEYIGKFIKEHCPVVLVDYHSPSIPVDSVVVDNRSAVTRIMEHLFTLGHRRIAFVCGAVRDAITGYQRELIESFDETERHETFLAEMQNVGGAPSGYLVKAGMITKQMEAALALLSTPNPPTAFVANDMFIGRNLMAALAARGISVPGTISVASVAATENDRLVGDQPMTSCCFEFREMGERAMELLRARRQGMQLQKPRLVRIEGKFTKGATTASPPR